MTQHRNEQRKERYISRHKNREDWNKSGLDTAGFYSKQLLWNADGFDKSCRDLKNKFPSVRFTYNNMS